MGDQSYLGSCPTAGPPDPVQIAVTLSHRDEGWRFPPAVAVGCPRETPAGEPLRAGEHCPQGGMHEVPAVAEDELGGGQAEQPPAAELGWAQSPGDGRWHAVHVSEVSYTCPDCDRTSHNPDDAMHGYCGACRDWRGVAAACGHRIPSAVTAEERPGQPACPDCLSQLGDRLISTGWSL